MIDQVVSALQRIFPPGTAMQALTTDPQLLEVRTETLQSARHTLQKQFGKSRAQGIILSNPSLLRVKGCTLRGTLSAMRDIFRSGMRKLPELNELEEECLAAVKADFALFQTDPQVRLT